MGAGIRSESTNTGPASNVLVSEGLVSNDAAWDAAAGTRTGRTDGAEPFDTPQKRPRQWRVSRWRLVPVAVVAWIVATVSVLVVDTATPVAAGLWCLTVVSVGVTLFASPTLRRAAVLTCLAAACAAVVASTVAIAQPDRSILATVGAENGRSLTATATVIGKAGHWKTGETAWDAQVTRIQIGTETLASRVPVQIVAAPEYVSDGIDVGSVITVTGAAESSDPGDRAAYQIRAARAISVVSPPQGVLAVAAELRSGLVRASTGLPEPGAGLLPGLAVGDTSAVSGDLDIAMKASSLSHLTAVSGANCALVVGAGFGLAALCGARRGIRVLVGVVCLGGFVLLVTPEPSVARAAMMAGLAMMAVLLGRIGNGIAVLCLSVAVLLMIDPWLAMSLGFSLSVAATAALLVLAAPLARGLSRVLPGWLALTVAVPLAAQLVSGPLLLVIDPSVATYGVLANVIAAPAAPAATMLGLLACLSAPFPLLQSGLTALAWLPSAWVASTALTVSSWPATRLPWLEGAGGMAALAVLGIVVVVAVSPPIRAPSGRAIRIAAIAVLCSTGGALAGSLALGTVAGPLTVPRDWSLFQCDIGQGDALLLRSGNTVALVDTGPDPEALTRCLNRAGITRVNLLVLTHFDLDHVGGVDAIHGRVDVVMHGPPGSAEDEALLRDMQDSGARPVAAEAGMSGALGEGTWRVLWPRADSRAYAPGNDSSVVLDVWAPDLPRALLLGDLSASAQRALQASDAYAPPYQVVKVSHHGSADQDPELYRGSAAVIGLISVGAGNTFGHPRAEILAVLQQANITTARTDQSGSIAVWRDGDHLQLWREKG